MWSVPLHTCSTHTGKRKLLPLVCPHGGAWFWSLIILGRTPEKMVLRPWLCCPCWEMCLYSRSMSEEPWKFPSPATVLCTSTMTLHWNPRGCCLCERPLVLTPQDCLGACYIKVFTLLFLPCLCGKCIYMRSYGYVHICKAECIYMCALTSAGWSLTSGGFLYYLSFQERVSHWT